MKKTIKRLFLLFLSAIIAVISVACAGGSDSESGSNGGSSNGGNSESTGGSESIGGSESDEPIIDPDKPEINKTNDLDIKYSDSMFFMNNGTINYTIVYPENATDYENTAVQEMISLTYMGTGIAMDSVKDSEVTDLSGGSYISIGKTKFLSSSDLTVNESELGLSGFIVKTVNDDVFLSGAVGMGTLYSVYEFLHYTIGYEYYADTCIEFKEADSYKLGLFDIKSVPDFEYRRIGLRKTYVEEQKTNKDRFRLFDTNLVKEGKYEGHSSTFYITKEEHPELYAKNCFQLCYSKPELVGEVYEIVIRELQENTDEDDLFFFFGEADENTWCECSDCKKSKNANGGRDSAVLIKFMNKLSDKVQEWVDENQPGRKFYFNFYAYFKTQEAPVELVDGEYRPLNNDQSLILRDNIFVAIAPIFADFVRPVTSDYNAAFKNCIQGWSALSKNVEVWSYMLYGSSMYINFYDFNALQQSMQYYASDEVNVSYIFHQGAIWMPDGTNFNDYRTYLLSKLSWNVNYDSEVIKNDFFTHYYKDAAPYMLKYFDELNIHYAYIFDKFSISGRIDANLENVNYWGSGMLMQWLGYFDKMYESIEHYKTEDATLYETLYKAVRKEELSVIYLAVSLYPEMFDDATLFVMKQEAVEDMERYGCYLKEGDENCNSLRQKWLMD